MSSERRYPCVICRRMLLAADAIYSPRTGGRYCQVAWWQECEKRSLRKKKKEKVA